MGLGGDASGGAACVEVMGPGLVSGEQVLVPSWPPEAPGAGWPMEASVILLPLRRGCSPSLITMLSLSGAESS